MQMTVLYAWNTLNAAFYGRLRGQPINIARLMIECELRLEIERLRTPFDCASGH